MDTKTVESPNGARFSRENGRSWEPTALWGYQSMSEYDKDDYSSGVECPTCGRSDFKNNLGMRKHHAVSHGESLSYKTLECEWCGEEYEAPIKNADGRRFCSKPCLHEWRSEAFSGDGNGNWEPSEYINCEVCGEETRVFGEQKKTKRFCSAECYGIWRSEERSGESHPQWKGGFGRVFYGPNWQEQRKQALERDGHACVMCGLTIPESVEKYGRGLDVHHIQPFQSFEEPERANKLDNLVTLCRLHHKRWEGIPLRPEGVQ